jgi:hypothetical protein
LSPNDPTPTEPATDGDAPAVDDAAPAAPPASHGERLPPGPDDVPISLPPPGSVPIPPELELAAEEVDHEVAAPADVEFDEGDAGADAGDGVPPPGDAGDEVGVSTEVAPAEVVDTGIGADHSDDDADAVVDEPWVDPVAVARPHPHTHRSRLTVLAVVVAVVASVLALTKAQQVGDLTTQRDDRAAIVQVSGRFGAAYLSFDFEHAEVSGKAVRALATPRFAASYTAQSAPGIQQLFTSRQTTTKATTTAVFVGPVTSDKARALVVVDVTATSPADGQQRLDDVSFLLDLDHTKAGWRVDKVARAPQPALADGTGTSVPAP